MPAQPDGSASAPIQAPWQRKPSAAPAWLPQPAPAPGSASQTPRWQPAGTPAAPQPGLPAMSPRGWPPSQQQQQQEQPPQHWQGGEAQGSDPVSPRPVWPPYQAQQPAAPMQWQGQAQSLEQSALPSPRAAWQPASLPHTHQQQSHANTVVFDPSPRDGHGQQQWQLQQSTFQLAPTQSQVPSWGSQEQQHAAQEDGGWSAHGDQSHGSAPPMGSTWDAEQMQAAIPMENGNHGQMDWQRTEQWEAQPEQVRNELYTFCVSEFTS